LPEITPIIHDIAWTGKYFVAVGEKCIFQSQDGKDWNHYTTHIDLYTVSGMDDYVIAVGLTGAFAESIDGNNWTYGHRDDNHTYFDIITYITNNNVHSEPVEYPWKSITRLNGVFYKVGINGITSMSWGPAQGNDLTAITHNNQNLLAVGSGGTIILFDPFNLAYSIRKSPTDHDLNDVIWNGLNYIVVGDSGLVLVSPISKN
jgi:hypothetical protein